MNTLEALSKAILNAVEQDEKLQIRRSKRMSARMHHDGTSVHSGHPPIDSQNPDPAGQNAELKRSFRRSTLLSEEEDDEDLQEDREKWGDDNLVLLYMVGFSVGLSNVWRFPYLFYQFGGGAFVIPYLTFLILCAYPFVYLELLVGQFVQVGTIAAWKYTVPLFKGVGICMTIIVLMTSINLNTVIAWCLFYLFQALFRHPLPWISCDNGFGRRRNGQIDPDMYKTSDDPKNDMNKVNITSKTDLSNARNWHTENCSDYYADSGTDNILIPTENLPGTEFLRCQINIGRVQRMWKSGFADNNAAYPDVPFEHFTGTNGLVQCGLGETNGVGSINPDTAIALFVGFVLIAICVSRGIRINGKIIISAVIIPYVVLGLLMFRATGLSGASSGLLYLFHPKFEQLANPQAWRKAAEQVFLSTGGGIGVHLTLASHNHSNRRILRDATTIVIVNSLTSILAAAVIFMFLGHIENTVGRSIDMLIVSGPELIFEVMADVLGELAQSNFYAFCFYFMLLLLGLATSVCSLICAKIAVIEVLPVAIKYKVGSRLMVTTLMGFTCFLLSAFNLTRGGLHVFAFYESFVGSFSLLVCAMLFLVGIAWIFGLRELVAACEEMGIPRPGIFFQVCWKYLGIVLLFTIFCGSIASPESYEVKFDQNKVLKLSTVVVVLGYLTALAPLLAVLFGALHAFSRSPGKIFCMKLLLSISPVNEHNEILETGHGKRLKLSHYIYLCACGPCGCQCCSKKGDKNKVAPADATIPKIQTPQPPPPSNEPTKPPPPPPSNEPTKSIPPITETVANPPPPPPPPDKPSSANNLQTNLKADDFFDSLFQDPPKPVVPPQAERPSNYAEPTATANVLKVKPMQPAHASKFN